MILLFTLDTFGRWLPKERNKGRLLEVDEEVKYSKHAPQKVRIRFRDFDLDEANDPFLDRLKQLTLVSCFLIAIAGLPA